MCSYCGCRNIPMIAQLNAEHDAIVNSSYALEIAYRDQDMDAARTACKELGGLLHPHTRREQDGLFAEMEKDELFTDHVASLCAEHDQLDADLEAIDAGDLTRIPTMIALLNNHIDREENGLFPKTFWVLFVIIVPWLGILVDLIARGKGRHERQLEDQFCRVHRAERRESDSAKTLLGSCFVRDRCRARRPMSGDTAVSNEMSSPVLRSKLRRTPLSSHTPRASTPAPTTAGTPRLRRLDHGRRDRGDQRCSTRPFRDSAGEAGRAAGGGHRSVRGGRGV